GRAPALQRVRTFRLGVRFRPWTHRSRDGTLAAMPLRKILLILFACALASAAFGQFGRQVAPKPLSKWPRAEFHMARLAYAAYGCAGSRGYCNPWWAIDYPEAENHFLAAAQRMTRLDVADDSAHVQLTDDELFDYPWLFLQQPGQ